MVMHRVRIHDVNVDLLMSADAVDEATLIGGEADALDGALLCSGWIDR
jgi:hypothetical protein